MFFNLNVNKLLKSEGAFYYTVDMAEKIKLTQFSRKGG